MDDSAEDLIFVSELHILIFQLLGFILQEVDDEVETCQFGLIIILLTFVVF